MEKAQQISLAVLDDDVGAAQSIAAALQAFGHFNTRAFFSAETLLEFDRRTPFNAFVLDWTVQGCSVEPLIHALRNSGTTVRPIIVLTGNEMLSPSAIHHLQVTLRIKPSRAKDLTRDIETLLARTQPRASVPATPRSTH